jgi:protein translocase SecG subunit
MSKVLIIIQIIVSILLAVSILLQNRGAGLSSTFGGDFGGYYTKRGFEKFLYWSSIILGFVFIVMAALIAYISARSA